MLSFFHFFPNSSKSILKNIDSCIFGEIYTPVYFGEVVVIFLCFSEGMKSKALSIEKVKFKF